MTVGQKTKRDEILQKLSAGTITPEQASKLLDENKGPAGMYAKPSKAGAISVYGLQRMPVTLYYEQWVALLPDDTPRDHVVLACWDEWHGKEYKGSSQGVPYTTVLQTKAEKDAA